MHHPLISMRVFISTANSMDVNALRLNREARSLLNISGISPGQGFRVVWSLTG